MKSPTMKRFVLSCAVVALFLIVTSPVVTVWLIKGQASRIMEDSLLGLTTSSLANMNVSEGFLQTAIAVSDTDTRKLPGFQGRIAETTRQVDAQFDGHRKTIQSDDELKEFQNLLERRADYRETRARVFNLLEKGNRDEARTVFEKECEIKFQSYAESLGKVVARNAREARERGTEIIRLCHVLLVIQILLLGFFFIYGFFVPLTAFMERLTRTTVVFKP